MQKSRTKTRLTRIKDRGGRNSFRDGERVMVAATLSEREDTHHRNRSPLSSDPANSVILFCSFVIRRASPRLPLSAYFFFGSRFFLFLFSSLFFLGLLEHTRHAHTETRTNVGLSPRSLLLAGNHRACPTRFFFLRASSSTSCSSCARSGRASPRHTVRGVSVSFVRFSRRVLYAIT